MTPLEIAGNAFTAAAVWLARLNSIHTWWVGLVGVTLYAILFFRTRLYADVVLQAFFALTGLAGWWQWAYGGQARTQLPISLLDGAGRVACATLVLAGAALAGFFFDTRTDAALPYADSLILSGSVVAQLLMMRRKLEHWFLWIAVDVVAVAVYGAKELYLTAAVYALLLAMCVQGIGIWRKEHDGQRTLAAPLS